MSTVFYGFRSDDRKHLIDQIEAMKLLVDNGIRLCNPEGIEIQVFHTKAGMIFRVLDAGYALRNQLWRAPLLFPPCNYDTRTEIPEEDKQNEAIVDEIEDLIISRNSEVISILPPRKDEE